MVRKGRRRLGGEGEVQNVWGQDTDTPRTRGAVIKTNRKLVSTAGFKAGERMQQRSSLPFFTA